MAQYFSGIKQENKNSNLKSEVTCTYSRKLACLKQAWADVSDVWLEPNFRKCMQTFMPISNAAN